MSESKKCKKCGLCGQHAAKYEGPRQYQHGYPLAPECIRVTCLNCGYSCTQPCDDANAGSHQEKQG